MPARPATRVRISRGGDRLALDTGEDLAATVAAALALWEATTPPAGRAPSREPLGFAAGDQPELALNTSLADTAITQEA